MPEITEKLHEIVEYILSDLVGSRESKAGN